MTDRIDRCRVRAKVLKIFPHTSLESPRRLATEDKIRRWQAVGGHRMQCYTAVLKATLARFIHEGHLARYVRKMRQVYKERRQRLLKCLDAELFDWLAPWPSAAGLHIGLPAKRKFSSETLAKAAERLGVKLEPLGQHGLALGYGAIEASQIDEGIRRLKQALRMAELPGRKH
jgi:DNA-binding transcriptional MocR family regulator